MAYDSNYIISALEQYGVSGGDAEVLAAVAYAESSYQAAQIGDPEYGYSIGLFQINLPAHSDELSRWTSSTDKNTWINWLSNVDNNIFAAAQIYSSQGLNAWTTYRTGAYQAYLGQNLTVSFSATGSYGSVDIASQFVQFVQAQEGKPYVYGATGPDSFDCSGLVYYVFNHFGVSIGRTSQDQWSQCQQVSTSEMQVGDLFFSEFDGGGQPGHVGIYIGNNTAVAAPHTGAVVHEYSISDYGNFTPARYQSMANAIANGGGGLNASGSSSFFSPLQSAILNLPKTNYQVVEGSAAKGDTLFGRRYRIIVSDLSGNTALDVSQLHCTFQCIKNLIPQPNYSQLVIYNLSSATENTIIDEGYRVVIEAGYEGSQYGVIFDGNVIQPIRDKPDGATYTLTLVCVDSDAFLTFGTVNLSLLRGQNSRSIVIQVVGNASQPAELGSISENFSNNQLTRGKVMFGMAQDYLRQLAQSENATFYMEDGKVNLIKAEDLPSDEIIDLTPETGLIGVPAQQDYGVTTKFLINPQVKIGSLIHVDNSLVRNQQFQQGQAFYNLDQDGIYRVIQLTTTGDTRGTDWYMEAVTVKQTGALPDIQATANTNMW